MYAGACGMLLMTGACDDIDENDRYIPVERPKIERTVLIQEFSGIRCVNCPDGAEVIHGILEQFPESAIAVSIHAAAAGGFTTPIGAFDLRCPEGDAYYRNFNVNALPSATIDGGAISDNKDRWGALAISAMSVVAPATITLDTEYDATSRDVKISYDVKFNQMYNNQLSILLWVVEDGIVGPQLSGSTILMDYVHNHILRTSANGEWGQEIGSSFVTEQSVTGEATVKLNGNWKAENCSIVGFIFQTGSKVTEQAATVKVIKAEEAE